MGQVKGKGKVSDASPEVSGGGGGNPPPPLRQRATGGPVGGGTPMMKETDLGGSQMRVGKEDRTRVPPEHPGVFKNEKHQDILMRLLTCTDSHR